MDKRRRNLVSAVAGTIVGLVAVVGSFLYAVTSALSDASMCANQIFREDTSPDGRWKVVVFERNCGATTRESTQVSIVRAAAALPNEGGNVFVAYVDPALVKASWTGPGTLDLSQPKLPRESVFRRDENVNNVRITHVVRE